MASSLTSGEKAEEASDMVEQEVKLIPLGPVVMVH